MLVKSTNDIHCLHPLKYGFS